MSEHVFPSGDWEADDETATERVASLAELILDQVSRPAHDWPRLRRSTGALDAVALAMAARYPRGGAADVSR